MTVDDYRHHAGWFTVRTPDGRGYFTARLYYNNEAVAEFNTPDTGEAIDAAARQFINRVESNPRWGKGDIWDIIEELK